MLTSTTWKHFTLRGGTAPTFINKKNKSKTRREEKSSEVSKDKNKSKFSVSCSKLDKEKTKKFYNKCIDQDHGEELKDCQEEADSRYFLQFASETRDKEDYIRLSHNKEVGFEKSSMYNQNYYQDSPFIGKDEFLQVHQCLFNQSCTSDRPAAAVGSKRAEIWNNGRPKTNHNTNDHHDEKSKKAFKNMIFNNDLSSSQTKIPNVDPAAHIDNTRGFAPLITEANHLPSTAPRIVMNAQIEEEFYLGEENFNDEFRKASHFRSSRKTLQSKEQDVNESKLLKIESPFYYGRAEEGEVAEVADIQSVAEEKEGGAEPEGRDEFQYNIPSYHRNHPHRNKSLSNLRPSSPIGRKNHSRRPNSCDSQISRPNLYSSYIDNDSDSVCSQSTMNSMGSWGSVGSKSVLYPVKMTAFDFGTLTYQNSNIMNSTNNNDPPCSLLIDHSTNLPLEMNNNDRSLIENPAAKAYDASGLPSIQAAADISATAYPAEKNQMNGRRPRSEASYRRIDIDMLGLQSDMSIKHDSNIPMNNCHLSSDLHFINNRPPSRQKNAFPVQLGAYKENRRKLKEKRKSNKEHRERDKRQNMTETYGSANCDQRRPSRQRMTTDSLDQGGENDLQEWREKEKEYGSVRKRERRDSNNSNSSNESNVTSFSRKSNQSNRSRKSSSKSNSSLFERSQRDRINNISDDPIRDGFLILDELEPTKLQIEEISHVQFPILLNNADTSGDLDRDLPKSMFSDRISPQNNFTDQTPILSNNFVVDHEKSIHGGRDINCVDIDSWNESEKNIASNRNIVLETNLEEDFLSLFAAST